VTPIVDVIIPVHRDFQATRRCIESVLAATCRTPFELVLVNDATPEADLARYLRDLREKGRATLIEQAPRQGFSAAVNRAFALHRDRDAVVLQSDAFVANDWLDRLARHAAERGVGVVATFTDNAGVATYPLPRDTNPLPAGYTVASLDGLFARANAGRAAALPAVDGPCLYFRRDCLTSVGAFDSRPLGSDYGVEIDFCLRAGSAGFRHLLAGDVFVGHGGHASFGEEQAEEMKGRTELALYKLFPAYALQKKEALEREPARPFARSVDLLRLADLQRPIVVFVSHPWGGGIRRYMNDLAALAGDRCEMLHLEPAAGDTVKLYWPRAEESFAAYFTLPAELPVLAATLRAIGVARLHFHHVHLQPRAILDLPSAVGVPYDCTLHDYYPICPQYHLVTETGSYCGEPDATGCAACLTRRPGQWGLDITAWRGAFGQLLRGADRLIAPSQDVAVRMQRYFPEIAINVWPHPEPAPQAPPRVARVAVLGNLSPEKGLHVVAACAQDARDRRLPLVFRLLGSTTEPVPQSPEAPLTIYGQYVDAELPRLIAEEKPDVLLFAAQVPETYAYTLSVALESGLPIVATALGAFTERLTGRPRTVTVPWDAPPAAWNSALLTAAGFAERPIVPAIAPPARATTVNP